MTFVEQFAKFLVIPLFWRKLLPADYGVLAVLDMVGALFGTVLSLQLESSVLRFYPEWRPEDRKNHLGTVWLASCLSVLLLTLLSGLILYFCTSRLFPDVAFFPYMLISLISLSLRSLKAVPLATIRMQQRSFSYAALHLTTLALQLVLSIAFVLFLDLKLFGLLLSFVIADAFGALLSARLIIYHARPVLELKVLRECLKFSLPLIPSFAVLSASQIVDRYLLQRFSGLHALGIYSVAARFAAVPHQLYTALKVSYTPFIVNTICEDPRGGRRTIAEVSLFYFLPIAILALAVGLFARDFVELAGQASYYAVGTYAPLLVVASIGHALLLFTPGLFLGKRSDMVWVANSVLFLSSALSAAVLIPSLQLTGIVMSRYVSVSAFVLVMIFLSQRYFAIPVHWGKVGLVLTVLLAVLATSYLIGFEGQVVRSSIRVVLFLLGAGGMVIVVSGRTRFRRHCAALLNFRAETGVR